MSHVFRPQSSALVQLPRRRKDTQNYITKRPSSFGSCSLEDQINQCRDIYRKATEVTGVKLGSRQNAGGSRPGSSTYFLHGHGNDTCNHKMMEVVGRLGCRGREDTVAQLSV